MAMWPQFLEPNPTCMICRWHRAVPTRQQQHCSRLAPDGCCLCCSGLPAQLLKLPAHATDWHRLRAYVQHVPCKPLKGSTYVRQEVMLLFASLCDDWMLTIQDSCKRVKGTSMRPGHALHVQVEHRCCCCCADPTAYLLCDGRARVHLAPLLLNEILNGLGIGSLLFQELLQHRTRG